MPTPLKVIADISGFTPVINWDDPECGFCSNLVGTNCHEVAIADGMDDFQMVPLCNPCRLSNGIDCEKQGCDLPHKDHLCAMNCKICLPF